MKYGDKIKIAGLSYNVLYTYEDYILVSLEDSEPENIANGTFVFELVNKKLKLVKDKETIKNVIKHLMEDAKGNK